MKALPIAASTRADQDILPIYVGNFTDPVGASEFCGTGFLIAPGILVTCWHCVSTELPEGKAYVAVRHDPNSNLYRPYLLESIFKDDSGRDLAMAAISIAPTIGFALSSEHALLGTDVCTFGYPFTDCIIVDGNKRFVLNARYLQGYITRDFFHDYGEYGPTPSYELSIPALSGLSGAPLIEVGTKTVLGVIYGNNDVATVVHCGSYDAESGKRTPDVERIVSFGLAHYTGSLLEFSTPLTMGIPLGEYLMNIR